MGTNVSVLLKDPIRTEIFSMAIEKTGSQQKLADYMNSKLKRGILRETIKGWKTGHHTYGWGIYLQLDALKELCKFTDHDYHKVLRSVIKYNPPWKDPRNKKYVVNKSKMKVINRGDSTYLDVSSILPQTTLDVYGSRNALPLFTKITKDKIVLWSESSWNSSKLEINRYIKIDHAFFLGCSIYFSEGTTKSVGAYNARISVGNTEPEIINRFIRFLDKLLIDYNAKFNISINCKNEDYKPDEIKDFWIQNIEYRIKKDQLKIIERRDLGSGLLWNNGVLHLSINSPVFKPLILNVIEASKNLVFKRSDWAEEFLRGLLICEGCINSKNGVLTAVSIGALNQNNRKFIKKLLTSLGFNSVEGEYQFSICGWHNFCKIYLSNLFDIKQMTSVSKYDKFIKGFVNCRETNKINKLLPFKRKKFTMKDWQQCYNLKVYNSPQNTLKWFLKHKFLTKEKIGRNVFYSILNSNLITNIWELYSHRRLDT